MNNELKGWQKTIDINNIHIYKHECLLPNYYKDSSILKKESELLRLVYTLDNHYKIPRLTFSIQKPYIVTLNNKDYQEYSEYLQIKLLEHPSDHWTIDFFS